MFTMSHFRGEIRGEGDLYVLTLQCNHYEMPNMAKGDISK